MSTRLSLPMNRSNLNLRVLLTGALLLHTISAAANDATCNLVQLEGVQYTERRKSSRYYGFNEFQVPADGVIRKYSVLSWSGSIKESNTTNFKGTQRTDFTGSVEYPTLTYQPEEGEPQDYTGAVALNTLLRREFRNLGDPTNEGDGSGGPYVVEGYVGGGCGPLNRYNLLTETPGIVGTIMQVPTQVTVANAIRREYRGHMGLLWSKIHFPCNLFDFQAGSDVHQSTGPIIETLSQLSKPTLPATETITAGYFPNATAGFFYRMENNSAWAPASTTPLVADEVSYDCVLQFRLPEGQACAGKSYPVTIKIERWTGSGVHTIETLPPVLAEANPSRTGLNEVETTFALQVGGPGEFAKISSAVLEIDGAACASCGAEPGATGGEIDSVNWSMNLGLLPGGKSAGILQLRSEVWTPALYTPAALRYVASAITHPEAAYVRRADGSLRQLRTGTYLIDLITALEDSTVPASGYEIRFYVQTGSTPTAENPALHAPAGSPLYVTRLQDPDGNGTRLLIQRFAGASTHPVSSLEYAYDSATNMWSLIEGGLRRTEKIITGLSASEEQVFTTVWDLSTEPAIKASETREKYRRYVLNGFTHRVLYERTLDPFGMAHTTTWEYLLDARGMLRLGQINRADGTWEKHQYSVSVNSTNGEATRIYNTYTPFGNSGPTSSSSQQDRFIEGEVTEPDGDGDGKREARGERYRLSGSGNIYWGERVRRFSKLVTFDGQPCYVTETAELFGPGFSPTDSGVRWERRYTYATGPFSGRVAYVRRPDDTLETITYMLGTGGQVKETRSVGAGNSAHSAVIDGECTVMVTDIDGRVESAVTTDIASGLVVRQHTVLDLDYAGRPTVIQQTDGALEQRTYSPCCGLIESVTANGITTSYTYDELGRQTGETRNGITLLHSYDALDRQISTTRRGSDGSEIVMSRTEYDPVGRVKSQTDALNRITQFAEIYNSDRSITRTTTNPDLGTIVEVTNADGRLASRSGSATTAVTHTYAMSFSSGTHSIITTEFKGGAGTSSQEWVKTHVDGRGLLLVTETPDDGWAENHYDGVRRLTKSVDSDGIATRYTYNALGELDLAAIDDEDNGIEFGGRDRITRTSRTIGTRDGVTVSRVTTEAWETAGQNTPTAISIAEQSIDGLRSWQTVRGLTTSSVTGYDGSGGRTVVTTTPDGTITTQVFTQEQLRSTTVAHPSIGTLHSTSFTYDPHGRVETSNNSRTGITRYTYFDDDQVHSVITPDPDLARSGPGYDPQVTTFGYDAAGRQSSVTQPDGGAVTTEYYPSGQIKKTFGARTYPVEYTYDDSGRIKTLKTWRDHANDAGAAVTTWNYDAKHGRLESKRYADGQGPSYTYTLAGRLSTRTWARGVVTSYGYDSMGDQLTIDYSDATPDVSFTYDRTGRPLTRTDAAGVCTWGYHANGQLDTEAYAGGPLDGMSLDRDFDSLARLSSLSTLSGVSMLNQVGYAYDAASRLDTVTSGVSTATYGYVADSTLVGSVTFKQGGFTRLTTVKSYDNLNRLSGITNTPSAASTISAAIQYNSANQRTRLTREDNSYWDYGYDALGQVTSAVKKLSGGGTIPGFDHGWTFDDIGNRQTATSNAQTVIYSSNLLNQYDSRSVPGVIEVMGEAKADATVTVRSPAANGTVYSTARQGESFYRQVPVNNANASLYAEVKITGVKNNVGPNGEDAITEETRALLVSGTPEAFSHDPDGNLTGDAKWTYAWDGENQLIWMETSASATAAGVPRKKLEFAYDGLGRRIAKKVYDSIGGGWVLVQHNKFLYDGWNLLSELNALDANSVVRTYAWGLDLSGSAQGAGGVGGLLFADLPLQTTTCAPAFDGNGNVIAYVDLATGAKSAVYEYGVFGETMIAEGVADEHMPFRFSTKFTDHETGLLYYGFRYYYPPTGRWLSKDPLEESGGANLYCFAGNNGPGRFDVLGLYQIDIHFYATYMVAKANGRSEVDAYKLAYYAQYPDQDHAYDAIPAAVRNIWRNITKKEKLQYDFDLEEILHSLHGGSPDQVKAWQKCLAEMVKNEPDGWQKGFMIHAFGDSFSHVRSLNGDGTAYRAPEGHLEDGTDPDIPQLRPGVLRSYLTALNTSLGGRADIATLTVQLTRTPIPKITRRRPHREGGDVYESESTARYRQAREISGFTLGFDPAKGKLDRTQDRVPREDVIKLLKKIKDHCGCTIGK